MPALEHTANRLEELAKSILEVSRSPDDENEVAAILESMGWSDDRVSESFGASDVFDLAKQLWPVVKAGVFTQAMEAPPRDSLLVAMAKNIRNFLRGVMFAAPMVISVLSMLTLRYSLWSYQYFSVDIATAIALGTLLSFSVTGGFTQAIARRGLMYVGQGEYGMARRMTFLLIRLGVITAVVVGFVLFFADTVFPVFPSSMMIIMLLYYSFLSAIWLSLTVFYMLQQEMVFTLLVSLGIGIVYVMHEIFRLAIIPSQVVALGVVSVLNVFLAVWLFRRAERRRETAEAPQMPRLSIVAYTVLPYFGYGFLYFTFLFVDRVMAWSSHEMLMPYVIWFRGEYELGLDWAIFALVLPMGVVETVVVRFSETLIREQKAILAARHMDFNRRYVATYIRSLISYIFVTVVSGIAVYIMLLMVNRYGWFSEGPLMSNTTMFVFRWAVVAYCILAGSLLNCLLLFTLSLPTPAISAITSALLVDVVVGFVLSRLGHYTFAIFGFVVGALVFVVLTTRATIKALSHLDFYLYSAS